MASLKNMFRKETWSSGRSVDVAVTLAWAMDRLGLPASEFPRKFFLPITDTTTREDGGEYPTSGWRAQNRRRASRTLASA